MQKGIWLLLACLIVIYTLPACHSQSAYVDESQFSSEQVINFLKSELLKRTGVRKAVIDSYPYTATYMGNGQWYGTFEENFDILGLSSQSLYNFKTLVNEPFVTRWNFEEESRTFTFYMY